MKKALLGLFLVAAVLTTGCLGESETQIIGLWQYNTQVNPASNNVTWNFTEGGQVYINNYTTSQTDTGGYEMYMDGTHRIVKIKNTDITDGQIPLDGEWYIVKIDFDVLVVGTKDQGGFIQRDLVR